MTPAQVPIKGPRCLHGSVDKFRTQFTVERRQPISPQGLIQGKICIGTAFIDLIEDKQGQFPWILGIMHGHYPFH